MKRNSRRKPHKSNHKFEAVREQELLVRVPLPNGRGAGGELANRLLFASCCFAS